MSTAPPATDPSDHRITRPQWKALIAAWLGWAFDGLDGFLYIMVATPFVRQLIANGHGVTVDAVKSTPDLSAEVVQKAAIIQAMFLVGWAVGGAVFGRLGDRLGRSRTLTLTILTYATFTGLSFFATQWWHLLIFRFIAALGIGGEWAAGSALVSETLHTRHRAWASAALQSGYMVGCILAALTAGWMAALEPRWVFVVGVIPAFLTVWIRRAVPEPEEWSRAARHEKPPPVRSLFSRHLWSTTVLTVALTGIALTTVWAFLYFLPPAIRAIPEVATWDEPRIQRLIVNVTVVYLLVNIAGNFVATYLARWIGYRAAFTILFIGALANFAYFFHVPLTLSNVYWAVCAIALTGLGLFGLFPLYIPPLFPTLVRTLGAGFTYNAGRLISGVGAAIGGEIAVHAGGPHRAIFWTGLLYIPGIFIALIIPDPLRRRPADTPPADGEMVSR